jgi:arylsulfatase A-like enzyme
MDTLGPLEVGVRRQLRMLAAIAVCACALSWASLPAARGQSNPAAAPPNIVLVLVDDVGYGDIGSFGAPDARTPNIDRLAREGVKLTDFYANGANCSPTRTGFISGRYQQRFGIEVPFGEPNPSGVAGLASADTSLPRLLKTKGYSTALVGKWHLGAQPEFSPNRHGFDEFWGFIGGSHDYYDPADLYHNGEPSTMSGYLTDEITSHATTFITAHQREPFFLEVSYNAAHWPFQPPNLAPDKRARPDLLHDGTRADYVAILERADKGVGEILTLLDRLQLARNTLVVFTSDNGGEWLSHNAPLFHRKSTLWEGGIRVPALMRWPAQLPAGAVSKQVGITMDLTASFLAAAGVAPPAAYKPEGINLLPMLKERRAVERTLFWRIKTAGRDQKAVRRGRWKYIRDGVGIIDSVHEMVFDLDRDIGERDDQAYRQIPMLVELRKLVADWEASVDAEKPKPQSQPGPAQP